MRWGSRHRCSCPIRNTGRGLVTTRRAVERAPSDRASEDTYEMPDDDSEKTGAQVLVGPASTQYEGSTNVFIGVIVFLPRVRGI